MRVLEGADPAVGRSAGGGNHRLPLSGSSRSGGHPGQSLGRSGRGRRNKREYYSIISLRSEKNHVSSFCSHWDNVLQH